MRARRVAAFGAAALLVLALAVSAARLDLDDDGDDSDVLDELLAIDEEAERGGLEADGGGAAEAVRRAQSMVLVLDNDNARRAVEDHAELLLLGYAPWCERSAQLMPRFAEAAAALRAMGSAVAFAKLDGDRYPKAAAAVGVNGFPTMLLFVNGTEHAYTGLHTKDAIVTWVRKKTGAPVIRLQSRDSAEEFMKKDQTFVIGLFKNFEGAEYGEFVKAATTDNEVQFVETNDRSVAKILFPGITSDEQLLGLVKSEPEKFEKFYGAFEEKAILRFVELNKFPLITVFTELNSGKVYSSPIKLQVFTFSEAYDFEDLESMLEEIARAFKTKIMFIYVDTAEENLAKPFLTLYGLESEKKPTVTAFDTSNGAKYLMEADINTKNLREFCLGLLDGTLPPYHKSEPVPQEKGLVEKVVGRTFDSSVLESPENIFLEVYTPWCVDCEAISKNVEKLAKQFSGLDSLKFARIDASVNEHPKLQVNNYPTLFLYSAEDKSKPIKISKKSSVKDMSKLIKEKLQISDVETVAATDNAPAADSVKDEL
ncbi:protein disulfide isomerase-like 1-5 [Phragmites australis]|uniref:protein disulfide isomerase-like 1-5 n=1 Tax=Phragmites australis TaxID=29695 RepID=UPI002D79489E|nr:protein disulfide isomerase-like 1-5 [Phragmites australis]